MTIFEKFRSDRSGNMILACALAMPVMVMAMGGALSYGMAYSGRSDIQNALDTALLGGYGESDEFDETRARMLFANNLNGIEVSELTFFENGEGGMAGRAVAEQPALMLQMFGMETIKFGAVAAVEPSMEKKIVSATFKPTAVSGAFDKDIYFFTRDASGRKTRRELVLSYDVTSKHPQLGWTSATVRPDLNRTHTINVGEYSSYGYEMVVYEDVTLKGNRSGPGVTVKSYDSDGPDVEDRMRREGACGKANGEAVSWEDGGDRNFQDFKYTVTCDERMKKSDTMRLVK
ncbi:TadE/TadG family type IV pilus assembly protein [Fulvimarina endophytica]|nr:TadE/TadG family type IV pilus assembly protein [Fulvimarina endophytica]